jgi:mannitol/fructose-specific phosphotransferase system IIA component (Ntr-type)
LGDVYRREQNQGSIVTHHSVWAMGKSDDLSEPVLAFARLARPMVWEGNAGLSLVFLAAFPLTVDEEAMGEMARRLENGTLIWKLEVAQTADEVKAALRKKRANRFFPVGFRQGKGVIRHHKVAQEGSTVYCHCMSSLSGK